MHDEQGYVWISHNHLLKQLPLLGISVRTLERKLKHLIDVGLIVRKLEPATLLGRRAFYRMSDTFEYYEQLGKYSMDGYRTHNQRLVKALWEEKDGIDMPEKEPDRRQRIPRGKPGAGRFERNSESSGNADSGKSYSL